MRCESVAEVGGRRVVLMDSISMIGEEHAGVVIVCGSHGGAISGAFAALHPPALVIFNDAGGGKADGGRAAIRALDEKGIPCVTVSHRSARIGDAEDVWLNGVLSAVGESAAAVGLTPGQHVQEAVKRFSSGAD